MVDQTGLRLGTAKSLSAGTMELDSKRTLLGFDGFVDEIVRMIDKRESLEKFTPIPTLGALAGRITQAAGKGTNIELVVEKIKIGGNGPIMANALAAFDCSVTYIGMLGHPTLHPVFNELADHAEVISIADPGHTDAIEFEDGKLMLGKLKTLSEVTWSNLLQRVGLPRLTKAFKDSHLLGMVNWTMIPHMSDIWKNVLADICPALSGTGTSRQILFFDLADPEKRLRSDILEALDLISQFEKYFHVILGVNEKEAMELAQVLDLRVANHNPDSIQSLAVEMRSRLQIGTVVIHPRSYAVAARTNGTALVEGPFAQRPLISTGAGDHFNAGFCVGALLNLPLDSCLLTGVSTSGYYVRTAQSPSLDELVEFMENWPK